MRDFSLRAKHPRYLQDRQALADLVPLTHEYPIGTRLWWVYDAEGDRAPCVTYASACALAEQCGGAFTDGLWCFNAGWWYGEYTIVETTDGWSVVQIEHNEDCCAAARRAGGFCCHGADGDRHLGRGASRRRCEAAICKRLDEKLNEELLSSVWYSLGRVLEGREGQELYDGAPQAPAYPAVFDGLCHSLGFNFWTWRGDITVAHYGQIHLRGVLFEVDCEGKETGVSREYNRSYLPFKKGEVV